MNNLPAIKPGALTNVRHRSISCLELPNGLRPEASPEGDFGAGAGVDGALAPQKKPEATLREMFDCPKGEPQNPQRPVRAMSESLSFLKLIDDFYSGFYSIFGLNLFP